MAGPKTSEIVHQLSYRPKERLTLFRSLELSQQVKVLNLLSRHIKTILVKKLSNEELHSILEMLDPNEVTALLQLVPKKRRTILVQELSERLQERVARLLQFDPKTAAGLMTLDYVEVLPTSTIAAVADQVRTHEERTGKLPVILIRDEEKVLGYVPLFRLALAKPSERVEKFVRKIVTVKHTADYHRVIKLFQENPHSKVVVLGENKEVLGVIFSDDILRIFQDEEYASLYNFAGVSGEETIYDPPTRKIKFRWKWLVINLGTAFLASFVVGLFHDVIERHVLLAVYMPIVAGMGGNSATQTLAVQVRGLGHQPLGWSVVLNTAKNEMAAALFNGMLNGLLVAAVVYVTQRNIPVAMVLAAAMVMNLQVAAFFGTIVPAVMQRLGKDPASSATIFITTATDVLGFMAFLGLATLLLG